MTPTLPKPTPANPTLPRAVDRSAHRGRASRRVRIAASRLFAASLLGVVTLVVLGPTASAHPLGNFSVNTYSGVQVGTDRLSIDYVRDSAEIPTVQHRADVDADGDGTLTDAETTAYADSQCLATIATVTATIDDAAVVFSVESARVAFPDGQAGLSTTRLECRLTAPASIDSGTTVVVADASGAGRVGWHEMTAVGDGTTLDGSAVPTTSLSQRLIAYPQDRLQSPLDVESVSFSARPGGTRLDPTAPSSPISSTLSAVPGVDGATRSFTDLIASRDFTLGAAIVAVLIAIFLGSMHALAPGHGKTVMAAYLVGRRGSYRQALGLCAAVTVTHTAGVLVLGSVLTFSTVVAPERIYPYLGAASGLLVASIGAGLLRRSWLASRRAKSLWATEADGHSHEHEHDHAHHDHERHDRAQHDHAQHDHAQHDHAQHDHGHDHDHSHDHEVIEVRHAVPTLVGAGGPAPMLRTEHLHDDHSHSHGDDSHADHDHDHDHDHDGHSHEHDDHSNADHDHGAGRMHSHGSGSLHQHPEIEAGMGWRSLIGMGFAGGMVPSPSALVVLLGAIALGRTWFGISLVIAYGVGMALSLIVAGLILVRIRTRLDLFMVTERGARLNWTLAAAPVITATLVIAGGLWIAGRALLELG